MPQRFAGAFLVGQREVVEGAYFLNHNPERFSVPSRRAVEPVSTTSLERAYSQHEQRRHGRVVEAISMGKLSIWVRRPNVTLGI